MSESPPVEQEVEVVSDYDLPPFGALIAGLADITEPEASETVDGEPVFPAIAELEEIQLTLAIELEIRDTDGDTPRVTGSTPTQWTETTVMPPFHRLTMHIARESDG